MPALETIAQAASLDLDHLSRMTCGDKAIEREVLMLFQQQSDGILRALVGQPAEIARLCHTLKGSARAVGAFRVGESAAVLEAAAASNGDRAGPLADLSREVGEVQNMISELLRRP